MYNSFSIKKASKDKIQCELNCQCQWSSKGCKCPNWDLHLGCDEAVSPDAGKAVTFKGAQHGQSKVDIPSG